MYCIVHRKVSGDMSPMGMPCTQKQGCQVRSVLHNSERIDKNVFRLPLRRSHHQKCASGREILLLYHNNHANMNMMMAIHFFCSAYIIWFGSVEFPLDSQQAQTDPDLAFSNEGGNKKAPKRHEENAVLSNQIKSSASYQRNFVPHYYSFY